MFTCDLIGYTIFSPFVTAKMHTNVKWIPHPVDHLACWPPAHRFHDQSHCGSFRRRCQTKVRKKLFSTLRQISARFSPAALSCPFCSGSCERSVGGLSSSKHCSAFLRNGLCERAVRITLDLSCSRARFYPAFYHIHMPLMPQFPSQISSSRRQTTVNSRSCVLRLKLFPVNSSLLARPSPSRTLVWLAPRPFLPVVGSGKWAVMRAKQRKHLRNWAVCNPEY